MKLGRLRVRIEKAEAAMEKALMEQYPVGTTVRCYIQHGQVNPSIGDVISHPGGRHAYLRLRLHSRTRHVRDVPAWDVQ